MNPFTILAPPMGQVLALLYDLLPNYGVAIILLTLLVSLLLFPLTLKQTRSMKAMQDIQPEVKKLQKELKGDREELNKQMMELYKERGVNPAAGCLPLIVQMPIWFALFRVLRVGPSSSDPTVLDPSDIIPEGRSLTEALLEGNSNFLGMDMLESPQDAVSGGLIEGLPAILLIVIVVASGFYQGYQTTKKRKNGSQQDSKQAQQMQTVMKIMPLFMGFISWNFPAGLVLYFAVSNLFRIGQQAVIFRLDGDEDEPTPKSAKDEGTPPTDSSPSKASPNASKKRNRRRKR